MLDLAGRNNRDGRAGGGEGKSFCAGEQRRPSRHASSARCGAGLRGTLGREARAGVGSASCQLNKTGEGMKKKEIKKYTTPEAVCWTGVQLA